MGDVVTQELLVIGETSYVTLQEANDYVNNTKMSNDPLYIAWTNATLSDDDKKKALYQSAMSLNNLKYTGKKLVRGQLLAFPRTFGARVGVFYTPFIYQNADYSLIDGLTGEDNGIAQAKRAQIENAVAHVALGGNVVVNVQKRRALGVTQKRADDISESYNNDTQSSYDAITGLYAPELVKVILKAWLTKSVYSL